MTYLDFRMSFVPLLYLLLLLSYCCLNSSLDTLIAVSMFGNGCTQEISMFSRRSFEPECMQLTVRSTTIQLVFRHLRAPSAKRISKRYRTTSRNLAPSSLVAIPGT